MFQQYFGTNLVLFLWINFALEVLFNICVVRLQRTTLLFSQWNWIFAQSYLFFIFLTLWHLASINLFLATGLFLTVSEVFARMCPAKYVLLKISQLLRWNTCARVSFLINFLTSGIKWVNLPLSFMWSGDVKLSFSSEL